MALPDASTVVIACPHCATRYQVPYATIGAKGRTVACAHCGKSWEAHAEPPYQKGFDELAEEALDEKLREEERRHLARREASARREAAAQAARARAWADAVEAANVRAADKAAGDATAKAVAIAAKAKAIAAAGSEPQTAETAAEPAYDGAATADAGVAARTEPTAAPLDPAADKRQQLEFWQRQLSLHSRLPIARVRRFARLAALGALLAVVGGGLAGRTAIVQQFPQLAGVYAALGLGVNVIGLEFGDVATLESLQQGVEVLKVSGRIVSAAGHEVALPQVIVTLLGDQGEALYEWSVTPKASELEPGESLPFETQLSAPPPDARRVRLTFANGRLASRPAESTKQGAAPATAAEAGSAEASDTGPIKEQ
jgi:predicted Zn finger-like uncharacterized protein